MQSLVFVQRSPGLSLQYLSVEVGTLCTVSEVGACMTGLVCDEFKKQCLKDVGAVCLTGTGITYDCVSSAFCKTDTGDAVCVAKANIGEPCFYRENGNNREVCIKGICEKNSIPASVELQGICTGEDLCGNACAQGEVCEQGICLTQAMMNAKAGKEKPSNLEYDSYCYNNKLYFYGIKENYYYLNGEGLHIIDCISYGYTGCVVYSEGDNSNGSKMYVAECKSNSYANDFCKNSAVGVTLDIPICISDYHYAPIMCVESTEGEMIAVPFREWCTQMGCEYCDATKEKCVNVSAFGGSGASCVPYPN